MRAALNRENREDWMSEGSSPRCVTLLELVRAVSEVTEDDREVVATVREMLRSGRVELCGNFRDAPVTDF